MPMPALSDAPLSPAARAYSVITIKAVDDEQRQIEGIASTPSVDRQGDIVRPMGARFTVPMPLLWQHRHDQPVGQVEFLKAAKDGISFRAKLPKIDEAGKLKERVDEAWQSVKHGLVRGVSIGFLPTEYDLLDDGSGLDYKTWDFIELSLVTIPANAEATIQVIKSTDAELLAASGPPQPSISKSGVSDKSKSTVSMMRAKPMATQPLADQVAGFEATRAAKAAKMLELMEGSGERGETLDSAEQQQFDELNDEVKAIDAQLDRIRTLERLQATNAKAVEGKTPEAGSAARVPNGAHQHVTSMRRNLPPGIAFARFVRASVISRGNPQIALSVAEANWPDMDDLHMVLRTAVAAGSTQSATWAGNLVQYQDMSNEFVEFLRPMTVIGRIPGLRNVPFNVRIPRQTAGASAYWVGEGMPKPLTSLAFDTITMRWTKVANIAVLTDEVARFSSPSVDALVRDDLAAAIVQEMDLAFLDPTNAGTTDVKPAAITNGAVSSVSAGTTADDVRTDIQTLFNRFITAGISTGGLVFIANETTATSLELMFNTLGQREFPGVTSTGGVLSGRPLVTSQIIPAAGSPLVSNLIALRPQDILLADDGQVSVDASREASLQMDNAPTMASAGGSPPAPTATSTVSMFQTNSVAIRAERFINWAKARSTAVSYISGVRYSV